MSSIPLVASAADVPRAVRYAERNPSARWYVARRAASLGCPEAVPAEWLEAADAPPLTAASGKAKKPASVLAKVIDAAWDAALHPRGRDGKFIEKGGAVDVVVPGWPKTRGTAVGVRKDAWGNEVLTISFEPDVYKKLQDGGHLPSGPYTKDESRVQLAPKWVEAAPDQKANLPEGGPEPVDTDAPDVIDPAEMVGELEEGWVVQLVVEGELVNDRDEALSALLAVFPDVDQADLGDVTPVDGRPGHWRTAIPGEVALRARNDGEFADSAEMVFAEDGDEFVDQVSILVNASDAPDLGLTVGEDSDLPIELTGYQKAFRKSFADEIRSYGYDALDDEDDDEELSSQIESLAQGIESGEFVSPEDALDQLDMLGVLGSEDREDIWRSAHLAGNQATYGPDDIDRMLDDTIEAIYGDADDWDDPDVAYPGALDREGKLDALATDVGDWDSAEDRGMALAAIAWAEDVSSADDTPEPELVEDLPLLLLNGEPDDIMEAYAGDSDLLSSIAGDFEQAGIDYPGRAGDLADQLEKVIEREAEAWSYTGSPADLGVDEADWDDYVADRDASIAEANMVVAKLRGGTLSDSDAPAPAAPVQPFGTYDPKYDHLREAWYGTILDADGNQLGPEEFEAAAAALGIRNPQFSPDGDGMLMELSDERLDQLANDGAIDVEAGGYRLEVEGFDSDDLAAQLADLQETDAPVPDSDVLAGKSVYQLREMALDPGIPADALERIARGDDELATGHALQNPSLPVDVAFDVMASSPSTGDDKARLYGWHLARRPDLTPDRIDQLRAEFPGSSPDEGSVHRQLALNTNVPAAVRNQIIADRPQLKLDPVPDSDAPGAPSTSGDYIPGADTPQAKLIYAGLYSSASNKGIDVVDTGIDQRLDALLLNPDREAAHKELAGIMTQLKLGGKQRKRYREMLDEHFGVDPDGSGSDVDVAKTVSAGLAPDNPLKAKLDAKIKELEAPLEADPEPEAPETGAPKATRVKGFTKAQTVNMREYYGKGGIGYASAEELGFDPDTIGETYIDVVDLDRAIEKLSADYADSSKWMKRNTPYKQYKALREQGLGLPGERQSVNNVRRRLERMRKEQGGAPKTSVPVATSTNVGPTAVDAGVAIKDLSDAELVGRYKVDLADGIDVKDVRRELVRRNISVKDAGEGLLVKKTTAPATIADVESIAKTAGDDSVRLMAAVDTLREVRTGGGLGDDTPSGKVLLAMARALNDNYVTKADGPKPLPPAYAKIYADELRPYDYEPGVAALVTALDKIAAGGPPGKA